MFCVAADGIRKIYRRGLLRPGRSSPPTIEIAVDRWVHAYRPRSTRTLCGLMVDRLHWEPFTTLEFGAVSEGFCCPRCVTANPRS